MQEMALLYTKLYDIIFYIKKTAIAHWTIQIIPNVIELLAF
jgi:hypothetical protein